MPEDRREDFISRVREGEMNNKAVCIRILNWHRGSGCEINADDDPKLNGYSVRLIRH